MSGESSSSSSSSNAATNSNIVDLLSTLNPAAGVTTNSSNMSVLSTPSTDSIRTDDMNGNSSDFVPANRLLTQRQALHNNKQRS